MREANLEKLEEFEEIYMRGMYGTLFDTMKQANMNYLLPILETENHCLIRMMRLLKQNDIVAKDFLQVLHMVEQSINANLISHNSLGKFLFRDIIRGRWFYLEKRHEKLKIRYLKAGFWNHYENLFQNKQKIYHSSDIFFYGQHKSYHEVVRNLYKNFLTLSSSNDKPEFSSMDKNAHIWDLYVMPFHAETSVIRSSVLKLSHNISLAQTLNMLVTHGMFISLNYVNPATE